MYEKRTCYTKLMFNFSLLRLFATVFFEIHAGTHFWLSVALQPFVGPLPLFQFLDFYAVGRTPWTRDQPVVRPLPIRRTAQTQNKRTQTSMPQVGLEPTMPAFDRAKAVHALDRAATVMGGNPRRSCKMCFLPDFNKICTLVIADNKWLWLYTYR
jgi:hypothetical protein